MAVAAVAEGADGDAVATRGAPADVVAARLPLGAATGVGNPAAADRCAAPAAGAAAAVVLATVPDRCAAAVPDAAGAAAAVVLATAPDRCAAAVPDAVDAPAEAAGCDAVATRGAPAEGICAAA